MKICYTVITNGYDKLRNPEVITPGWKYICITDNPETCKGTVYEPVEPVSKSEVWGNRFEKWIFGPNQIESGNAEKVIYHDGNFQVIGNLDEFCQPIKTEFAARPHPSRTNIIEELQACANQKKIDPSTAVWVLEQIEELENDLSETLTENGLLVFQKGPLQDEWNSHFWHLRQLLPYCHRDQLLLPMVLDSEIEPELIDRQHAQKHFKHYATHLK